MGRGSGSVAPASTTSTRTLFPHHLTAPPLSVDICPHRALAEVRQVALTYTATIIVALAAGQAGRPDLIRSPQRVLAHTWEGF